MGRRSDFLLDANLLILRSANITYELAGNLILIDPYKNHEWIDRQGEWQSFVKMVAIYNQDRYCECGKNLVHNGELHHALVERNESSGFFIHNPLNCIVLHTACHRRLQGKRGLCYTYLTQIYGKKIIDDWRNAYGISKKV